MAAWTCVSGVQREGPGLEREMSLVPAQRWHLSLPGWVRPAPEPVALSLGPGGQGQGVEPVEGEREGKAGAWVCLLGGAATHVPRLGG